MNETLLRLPPGNELRKPVRHFNTAYLGAALACCLLVMVGCMAASGMFAPKVSESAPVKQSGYTFTELAPQNAGTVQSVTVTTPMDAWTLMRADVPQYDRQKAEKLLDAGASVISRMSMEGNLSDFGLDVPAAKAVFTYENGTSMTLAIGDAVAGMQGRYAAVDTAPGIHVVSEALYQELLLPREARFTVPDLSAYFTSATLQEVSLTQPGRETLCIRRVTEQNPFNMVAEFTAPIHYPCNATRTGELFLALDALQPQSVQASADEAQDVQRATLTLTDEKGQVTLLLGERNGCPILRISGSETVYSLADGALDFLKTATVAWLAEQTPGLVMLKQVQSLTITCGSEVYCFDMTAANDSQACLLNGKPLDRESLVAVYKQCIGLLIERYEAAATWPTDTEADVLFTYQLQDGELFTLAFASYDEHYHLIRRGDDAHFLISSDKIGKVVDVIRALGKEENHDD